MEETSYQFSVIHRSDFLTVGMLRRWPGGNQSALQHLENAYPDWTEITIHRINETSPESS
jgi:hypothetical protein